MPSKPRRNRHSERRPPEISTSGQESGGKSDEVFHFVSVNPSSEVQKSENRSLIRSHASKYIWRQHRAVRADGGSSSRKHNRRAGSGLSHPDLSSFQETTWAASPDTKEEDGISVNSSPLEARSSAHRDESKPETQSPRHTEIWQSGVQYQSSKAAPISPTFSSGSGQNTIQGPFNQLITWLEDPFHTYPSMLGESAISKLMRYAAFDLWPGLVLGAADQKWDRTTAAEKWLPRAMANPALFTAFLYGAAGHMQTRKRLESTQLVPQTREEKLEQIICETETIKQLNKMMQDPSQACSDDVILAVLCMAFNRIDYSGWNVLDTSPKAPLRNLQWLDVYGGLSLNDHHVKGLLALIQTKGGLTKMKLPGLPETLSTSAIMLSTKYLVKPRLPFVGVFRETAKGATPKWPSLNNLGTDISKGPGVISKSGLPSDLVEVLCNMKDYNGVINLYCQGLLQDLELVVIADRRNWIQYSLVSLSSVHEFHEQFFQAHTTYEACRLGAMIYSMLVIFPLPAANRPFRRLSGMVKTALVESDIPASWHASPELLLWILVLGGVAAKNTEERVWFANTLDRAAAMTAISSWEELKEVMSSVMWMDCVCDPGGQTLWNEISES